ncbi:MAG: hypothetical protein JNL55_08190, partial [Steroidobacter sp.]
HMSTPHRSLYDALQALFAGWRMPRMVNDVEQRFDMRDVDAHYSALATRFGFPIAPSPAAFAVAADGLLATDSTGALAIMRRAVLEYPYLAGPHRQLAEALERLGRKEEALLEYERAVRAAVDDEQPFSNPIDEYRAKLKALARNPN